jgi:hypothetical protein
MVQKKPIEFINLKNHVLAEYKLIYRINDCYKIKDVEFFNDKHQLLFQKIDSKILHLNLIYCDSIFPNILSDIALEVFINKINCIEDYINSKTKANITTHIRPKLYLLLKFYSFVYLLLYSDINQKKTSQGFINTSKVYCYKNKKQNITFYEYTMNPKLREFLKDKIKFEINFEKTRLERRKLKLNLKIFIDR